MTESSSEKTELDVLKERAKQLGITFSNNIKLETLKKKVDEKLNGEPEEESEEEAEASESKPLTKAQKMMQHRAKKVKEATRLVRLRITNLDPKKANLPGEIICVGNKFIGTIKKFVPFGEATEDGYHVPWCIYQELKARKFLQIRTLKDKRTGRTRVKTEYVREFALEVLDPLTQEELDELARRQAAAGSTNDED